MTDETGTLLRETAERLFERYRTAHKVPPGQVAPWLQDAWAAIEEAGLTRLLLPEEAGGFGVSIADACSVLRLFGAVALPVPLIETLVAGWLLAQAGLEMPNGAGSVPGRTGPMPQALRTPAGWHLHAEAARVPWGRHAAFIGLLVQADGKLCVALVPATGWSIEPGENLAREPRDHLIVDAILPADAVKPLPANIGIEQLRAVGAALRVQQIAGALDRALAMTVDYASTRVQFGRPIAKYQAVQHGLAVLATQACAARGAADLAVEGLEAGANLLKIASAKTRAGEAAGIGAGLAHQLHGAIGFSYEHELHLLTQRLWTWRDDFGSEAEWSLILGRALSGLEPSGFWAAVSAI